MKAMLISPLVSFPIALVLMAVHGWWTDNLEAMFAAVVVAPFFTIMTYPIAVIALWIVRRLSARRSVLLRVLSAAIPASLIQFALLWRLSLPGYSALFMMFLIGVTALTWATVFELISRRRAA